ncbi:peptide ABC transporter substrate-binding protein [Paracoccaceae bacterium GXU_MW_L88]
MLKTIATVSAIALMASQAHAVTYMRGNDGDPETLDHHKTSTVAEGHIMRDLFEGLVIKDANNELAPGVAESWEESEDGTVYTFTIREDAKWSNGDPVTANDFVFAFRRLQDPATAASYATIQYAIKNAEAVNTGEMPVEELGIRAVDDKTLEITLEQPTPYFIELLTHQTGLPMHPASVEAGDFTQAGNMVSNGAYTLQEVALNERIVLQKNPEFHDAENVAIDEVQYIPFEDRATCVRRWEAGEIHSCSDLPAEDLERLKAEHGDAVRLPPYLGTYYYDINTERFDDVNVRQALNMVIDREFLANEIWQGSMAPAYGYIPPGIGNYEVEAPTYEWSEDSLLDREDAAIALMEEAGYSDDNRLEIELSYNTSENHKATATAIAEMWAPIYVDVTYNVRDASAHYAHLRDTSDYDVVRAGWIGDYSDPQNFLFLLEQGNDGFNYANYANDEYDALMEEAAAEQDLVARAEIMKQAEEIVLRDVPRIPLLWYSSHGLVSPKLQGWVDNIDDNHPTRFLSIAE